MRTAMTKGKLEAEGFKLVARWPEDWRENDVRALFSKQFPRSPGVYAFVKDDEVVYIGKAERQSLQKRLRKYVNSKPSGIGVTAKRVQGKVDEALAIGKEVSAYFMTLDAHEIARREAELIRDWQPRWNKQGIRSPSNDEDIK
jgi:excinuclease UvrABC nuclease subunit